MSVTVTSPPAMTFAFTIDVEAPDVVQVLLNGGTGPVTIALPPDNAGDFVAAVTVISHSGSYSKPLQLTGADGNKFVLSGGGVAPCDLRVGAADIVTGSYAISIKAP